MNRILLIGGAALALSAILLAVLRRPFDGVGLAINLAAIAVGLLMGRGIGRLLYRRA